MRRAHGGEDDIKTREGHCPPSPPLSPSYGGSVTVLICSVLVLLRPADRVAASHSSGEQRRGPRQHPPPICRQLCQPFACERGKSSVQRFAPGFRLSAFLFQLFKSGTLSCRGRLLTERRLPSPATHGDREQARLTRTDNDPETSSTLPRLLSRPGRPGTNCCRYPDEEPVLLSPNRDPPVSSYRTRRRQSTPAAAALGLRARSEHLDRRAGPRRGRAARKEEQPTSKGPGCLCGAASACRVVGIFGKETPSLGGGKSKGVSCRHGLGR